MKNKIKGSIAFTFSVMFVLFAGVGCAVSQAPTQLDKQASKERLPGWKTNIEKRSVELGEFMSGGPPKDGIPAIDAPKFVNAADASTWLQKNEPVISLTIKGESRAYPLQILMWHEIANDEIQGQPVTVTFCPLCYTAIVFDRRLDGKVLDFGVSGMLRHSDMVMYDRQTETWWQQISGEGLVGDLTGKVLKQFPAQIVSFEQFSKAFPKGTVLSRETGHRRDYGRNPYTGYDSVDNKPFLFKGKTDERLRPMEKVVAIDLNGRSKAYPHTVTLKQRVIHDRIGETDLVVFHADGAASAMDSSRIAESKEIGSTGVFKPFANGKKLTFRYDKGEFVDNETGSRWNVFGKAVNGELKDAQLEQITHGDIFAFAWLVFKPETEIYKEAATR
jgi:hypothetical protein